MPRQRVKPTEPKPKRQRSGLTPTDLALLDRVIAEKCTAKTIWGASVKATRSEALRMLCWQALGLFVATASAQTQAGPPASEPLPGAQEPGNEAPKGQETAAEWGPLSFHPRITMPAEPGTAWPGATGVSTGDPLPPHTRIGSEHAPSAGSP